MSLLMKRRPLLFSPELARRVGLSEAIALQQICYWVTETESGVEHQGRRWIYNTYAEWAKQFPFWSEDTIKRTMNSLRTQGLILVEQLNKSKHDRTNYYTVNDQSPHLFDEGKSAPSMSAQSPLLHPEITTEKKSTRNQQADDIPYEAIRKAYQKICGRHLKPATKVTDERKKNIKLCWNYEADSVKVFRSGDFWKAYFEHCVKNPHWRGETGTWKASLEFVTRKSVMEPTVEALLLEMGLVNESA